ncbi:DsbA family protein [Delftia acidovorans]|uniref:DsbA family protein n=1 Tax=Delftia acidovorans TaxID=80866 RepID=UPI002FDEBFF0
MKQITFHLDFISPYAWLAFAQLPQALQGISHHMQYRPVLLGALLQRHANPGPAGIAGKREWTYRHVSWLGHATGAGLDMPARHPFNPLPLLRLALECSDDGTINRFVADAVLRHVWLGGADALDPARLDALRATLAPQLRTDAADNAKRLLRENTEAAAAQGLFGVPAWEVDGRLFWGLDSLPMLRAYLEGDGWFASGWDAAASVEQGLKV